MVMEDRLGHGSNGFEPRPFGRHVFAEQTLPFKYIRDSAIKYNRTRILDGVGPYLAEVVRVFEPYDLGDPDSTKVPIDYWQSFAGQTEGKIVIVRARIPEIDTFGVPANLATDDASFAALPSIDRHRIERYPKCVAQYKDMEVPSPGQAVWVDFRDPKNRSGRMYLGLVSSEQLTSVSGEVSTRDAFNSPTPDVGLLKSGALKLAGLSSDDLVKGGTKITEMFRKTSKGIWIKTSLAHNRWARLKKELEERLNREMPGQEWKVPSKGHASRRELSKAAATNNPLRAAGSLHGVGLASDFIIISKNYPDGYGNVQNQNKKLIKNAKYLKTVNDFINEQSDIWWGGYIRKGELKSEISYLDKKKNRSRQLHSGELHHFEIYKDYYSVYFEAWKEALQEVGFSRIPNNSKERQDFYRRVIQRFGSVSV